MPLEVNPSLELIELSAKTGEGMQDWIDWIHARIAAGLPVKIYPVVGRVHIPFLK